MAIFPNIINNCKTFISDYSRQTLMVVYYLVHTNIFMNVNPFLFCNLLQMFEVCIFPPFHIFLQNSSKVLNLIQIRALDWASA